MKDTIWLKCDKAGVRGMTKGMPDTRRGEIAVKLVIEVQDGAYTPPVAEQHVTISDWREGTNLPDVDLREAVITEDEAQVIRDLRIAAMRQVLEERGFTVTAPGTRVPAAHLHAGGDHDDWLAHDGYGLHRHDGGETEWQRAGHGSPAEALQ
jgi:hypothetical protein